MTENNQTPDNADENGKPEIIEPEIKTGLEQAVLNRRKRTKKNPALWAAVAFVLIGGVGLTVYKQMNQQQQGGNSRISRAPTVDSTPAGQQLAESPRYKDNLDTVNQRGSEEAAQTGKSFIAVPDEPLRDVDQKPVAKNNFRKPLAPANEPEVQVKEEIVVETRREQAPPPPDYSRINQLAKAITQQASTYERGWSTTGSVNTIVLNQELYKTPAQRAQEAEQKALAAQVALAAGATPDYSPNNAINAGQFAFARMVNSTDSDTPGPVIAEIMKRGPLYKTRLIGAFQSNETNSGLIVEFNRMVFPDGTEQGIAAYAVDANKGSISVKSEVDKRLFSRYAPLIAASFIEGLGNTLSESGSTLIYGSNTTTLDRDKPTFEQGLYAGAGKVGQRMAEDIEKSAPKNALVKLNAGKTIGILFLQGVPMPLSMQAASESTN